MEVPYVPTSTETVTEDWVKKVIAKEFGLLPANRNSIAITRLLVSPGSLRTDGFLSRLQRIEVKAKLDPESKDGDSGSPQNGEGVSGQQDEREFHLVAKLYPPGEVHQKIVRNMRAFEREIHAYTAFQDLVMKHQPATGDPSKVLHLSLPKCYFTEIGMDASCIVMEDLKHSGFRLNDKKLGMTLEHAKLCVVAEANYCALGINAKKRIGLEEYILANAPLTLEPFSDQFGAMMDFQLFPGTISFAKGQNRKDLADKLQSYQSKVGSIFRRFLDRLAIRGPLTTFVHGDCWNNNYMFRHERNDQGEEVPVEVKILDLQISRYANPTNDLSAFLLCNLEREVIASHLDSLIDLFYETMASTLDKLETPDWSRETYSLDHFRQDMAQSWEYGFLAACWLVPMTLSADEDIPNFDEMKEDHKVEEFFDGHEEKMSRGINETVVRRFTGVLEFAVERGLI